MPLTALRALAAAALAATALVVAPAGAAPVPGGATHSEHWIRSADGTQLHADVLLPENRKSTTRHPVIVSVGPYFATDDGGPSPRFNDLIEQGGIFRRGYAFVMVDSRGYGSSGGCSDLGGPGEQSDVKAAVEWAAKQPWSTGKVGMWGKSYDAWTQVMALAGAPKGLAAVVIQAPLIEGYRGFFENGVHWDSAWYVTPGAYALTDLTPPGLDDDPMEIAHALTGTATNPHCYALNQAGAVNPDPSSSYWRERNLVARAARSKVPTLWSHGFNDQNTKPTNIFPVYSALTGPKRAWFGQWAHDRGNEADKIGRNGFMAEAMNWLDHWLKGLPLRPVPPVEVQDADGGWRTEKAWPPADAVLRRMPLLPGSWEDREAIERNRADAPVGGTWSVSQPAPHDVRLAGLPQFRGDVTTQTPAGGNLVALVYDVAPDGTSRVMTRGAFAVSGAEDEVAFELWPLDWKLRKGHRVAVQLSNDEMLTYQPTYRGGTLTLEAGELLLPILRRARTPNLAGENAIAADYVPTADLGAHLDGRQTRADFGPRPSR